MANFPFFTNIQPGFYGPTDTETFFFHEGTELIIHADRLELIGNVKDAALILAKTVLSEQHCTATAWNNILRAEHDSYNGRYTLEYLGDNKPDFFDELKEQFEKICKMRAFM